MNKIFIFILFLILLSSFATATGICVLDKEEYHPGETGILSCSCTTGLEKDSVGYIVWRNSSEDILQSVLTNSNNCQIGIFGGSYTFLQGQNFTGNATFSLNANGTGDPIGWGDVSDVTSDNFNITGAHETDCIIEFESNTSVTSTPILGRYATLQVIVKDGVSGNTLTHANCHMHIIGLDNIPLLNIPYTPLGDMSVETGAFGEFILQHKLDEKFWQLNTFYLAEINCYCTANGTDEECFIGGDGLGVQAGFKECQADILLQPAVKDERFTDIDITPWIWGLIAIITLFGVFGWVMFKADLEKFSFWVTFLSWSITGIEICFMLGIIYLNSIQASLFNLLKINFYIMSIVGIGLLIMVMFYVGAILLSPDTDIKKLDGLGKRFNKD